MKEVALVLGILVDVITLLTYIFVWKQGARAGHVRFRVVAITLASGTILVLLLYIVSAYYWSAPALDRSVFKKTAWNTWGAVFEIAPKDTAINGLAESPQDIRVHFSILAREQMENDIESLWKRKRGQDWEIRDVRYEPRLVRITVVRNLLPDNWTSLRFFVIHEEIWGEASWTERSKGTSDLERSQKDTLVLRKEHVTTQSDVSRRLSIEGLVKPRGVAESNPPSG